MDDKYFLYSAVAPPVLSDWKNNLELDTNCLGIIPFVFLITFRCLNNPSLTANVSLTKVLPAFSVTYTSSNIPVVDLVFPSLSKNVNLNLYWPADAAC